MTDVIEGVEEKAPAAPRVLRTHTNSTRIALGKLANLPLAARVRYGNMIDEGSISLSPMPLTLNGATLGDRKQQLASWLRQSGAAETVIVAIASKLRPAVNYVRYVSSPGPDKPNVLIVEVKPK